MQAREGGKSSLWELRRVELGVMEEEEVQGYSKLQWCHQLGTFHFLIIN